MSAHREEVVRFLLRSGIAFAFIYPAVAAYFDPFSWIGFFPSFIRDIFPDNEALLLHFFGATEIVIALWILLGRKILIPSIAAALFLVAIVLFNLSLMDIVFRDIAILAMVLALIVLEHQPGSTPSKTE